MSARHNLGYQPPFPSLQVILRDDESHIGPFSVLLDTGADISIVPARLLEQIGATRSGLASIRSHFGDSHVTHLYLIGFQIHDTFLPAVYVVGDAGDEIILGRDVLNKLPLFLDGPSQQTDLLDDAMAKQLRARRK